MIHLFSPLQIRNLVLKNRIVMSPMCQYSSEDGFANDWHLVHLGSRAVGGAALIFTEATAVCPRGRITPHDVGIWKDEHIESLKRITSFIRQQNSASAIQLAHAGRKASRSRPWEGDRALSPAEGGWQVAGPGAMSFHSNESAPHSLSIEEIGQVIDQFARAAARADAAGFDVVEIHAAHGYLLHEFYSPLSNIRQDSYGGSFENRVRLLLEVTAAVRTEWPQQKPLFVRISATDWVEGGWTKYDSVELAKLLKEQGADLIDCSSGGNVPDAVIPAGPNYQVQYARSVKQDAGILTGAVGIITEPHQAEAIIAEGKADIVLIGRELLRDPYFALRAAKELEAAVEWPPQYLRARR